MPVRGSPNYVWFTEQTLGSGATGNVYFGRHKRMGDVCAVKVFTDHVQPSHIQAKTRELELMRRLSHRNIVRLLAIEQESHTKEKVLIMEMCSEGSVYDMLLRPENFHGFPETQFVEFFHDFVCGMEYLRQNDIVHRDIKPGNVLCSKLDDRRLVYKLTDFGAARKLEEGEMFMSMYGTAEYLHPDVYGSALLGTISKNPTMFTESVDIWSMGATLYHVATGQLPFQPRGGRTNRDTMFKMITDKPSGSVSAVQLPDGKIDFKNDFPECCVLSRGLRNHLLPLIAGTLEPRPRQQLTFEKFFEKAKLFIGLKPYHIRCMLSFTVIRLYLREAANFTELCRELTSQTGVPEVDQTLVYGQRRLCDLLNPNDVIATKLLTSDENPIAFSWFRSSNREPVVLKKIIPSVPTTRIETGSEAADLPGDAVYARQASAFIIYTQQTVHRFVSSQVLLAATKSAICENLATRRQLCIVQLANACELFLAATAGVELMGDLATQQTIISQGVAFSKDSGIGSTGGPSTARSKPSRDDSGVGSSDPSAVRSKIARDGGMGTAGPPTSSDPVINMLRFNVGRLQRLQRHIDDRIQRFDAVSLQQNIREQSECARDRCEPKLAMMVEQATDTYKQFMKDKTARLSYNESQIHRYDKIKLDEIVQKKANVLFESHCFPKAKAAIDLFKPWHSITFKKSLEDICHIEKDLEKFQRMTRGLIESVNKANEDEEQVRHSRAAAAGGATGGGAASKLSLVSERTESPSSGTCSVPELEQTRLKKLNVVVDETQRLIHDTRGVLNEMDSFFFQLLGTVRNTVNNSSSNNNSGMHTSPV